MRFVFILIFALPATAQTNKDQGCGVGEKIGVQFLKPFAVPAIGSDEVSRNTGVGTIVLRGVPTSRTPHGITCTITNEVNEDFVLPTDRVTENEVARSGGNRIYLLGEGHQYQLTCDGEGLVEDFIASEHAQAINESLAGQLLILSNDCISQNPRANTRTAYLTQ